LISDFFLVGLGILGFVLLLHIKYMQISRLSALAGIIENGPILSILDRLVVAIPVKNEERHVVRVYNSATKISKNIFFFDSDSTDDTPSLIQSCGAVLVDCPSVASFSEKLNFIYSYPPFHDCMIFVLHADETISSSSVQRLLNILKVSQTCDAYSVIRQSYFLELPLKWGRSSQRSIRLARYKSIKYQDTLIDEDIILKDPKGAVIHTSSIVVDNPIMTASQWFAKHNTYSDREAQVLRMPEFGVGSKPPRLRLYYNLPILLRPFLLFFVRYVLLLGFLDGRAGLAYHLSHSLVYRLMVDIKILFPRDIRDHDP
jgi:glycosyltransferase involved in cell wall biosynthesis